MPRAKKPSENANLDVLDRAVDEIRAKWGQGSIHAPNEELSIDRPILSTGIPPLDDILGNGGFARGTVVELFGQEGSGKTTCTLQLIAEAQRAGMKVLFIDMEHSLSVEYAKKLGVDIDMIYITQPDNMEQALGILETFVKTGEIGLVVVDSLASLVPEVEQDLAPGKEPAMALQARHLSLWFRRFNPILSRTNTLVLFTNQLRDKVGSWAGGSSPPGGRAVKFFSSYRIQVKIVEGVTDTFGALIGNKLTFTTVKNRFAYPYQKAEVILMFGEGIDLYGSVLDQAVDLGIIEKAGSWYKVNEVSLPQYADVSVQGKMSMRNRLKDDPEFFEATKAAVKGVQELC